MKEILAEIGINVGISVAGLFGSLLMIGKKAAYNLRNTFFSLISGVASANYITPLLIELIGINQRYQLSIAFVLGFLGLKGVEIISNRVVKETVSDKSEND
jgi:hypothetical protein